MTRDEGKVIIMWLLGLSWMELVAGNKFHLQIWILIHSEGLLYGLYFYFSLVLRYLFV